MHSVAVIGAGITGLTAAFYLQRNGIPVTVYEAAERVGGVIQTLRRDGYLAEFGPNTILETSPLIGQLVRDAGLQACRLDPAPEASARYVVRGKRPVALPGSPLGFLTTRLFSARAKLAVLCEPFVPARRDGPEETVADFVVRRLGREFLDHAIDAMVAGVYAGDPARLSLPQAFPRLAELEARYGSLIKGQIFGGKERRQRGEVAKDRAPKFSFDEGLAVLPETLRQRLGDAVRLNTLVIGIAQESGGWVVSVRDGGEGAGRETQVRHSAVLYAGTAHQLAQLRLDTPNRLSLADFAAIRYPPVASVVLGFRRADVADPCLGFGMLIPRVEGFKILGTLYSSALFPNRAPAGHLTLTTYVGGERYPELAALPAEQLVALTCDDLRILLGVRGRPTFTHTVLYPRAIPQYNLGYGRFRDTMTRLEAEAPGLFLAGHYREGISVGDSIVSACHAAGRIGRHLQAASPAAAPGRVPPVVGKGVLLVNLGSPETPSVSHVRRYLREFLMDPRVLDVSWPVRFAIVHCAILPTRPRQAAHAYQSIWTAEGSPLVVTSRHVQALLQAKAGVPVELAMRYQKPSIEEALRRLAQQGVAEALLIPLFPHFAWSSVGTAVERVRLLAGRLVPGMKITVQPPFYDHPDYIAALAASARPFLARGYDHLLFSFHGLPERHLRTADPSGTHCLTAPNCCDTPHPAHATCYRAQCHKTVAALVRAAGIPGEKYSVAFQSRLGRDPWLKPYTDFEVPKLAQRGVKNLLVMCPAFVSDCLETLEEIGIRARAAFRAAGGTDLTLIPCLNEHPLWLAALDKMIARFVNEDSPG